MRDWGGESSLRCQHVAQRVCSCSHAVLHSLCMAQLVRQLIVPGSRCCRLIAPMRLELRQLLRCLLAHGS